MDLSDQKTQIILLSVVGALGLLYAWFTYFYTPRADQIGMLQTEIGTLQSDISTLRIKVARLPRVQADQAAARAEWQEVLVSFPTEPREDEVIASLTASEQTTGLFIRQITPGERRTRPLYFEQDYSLNMVGRYHQLGAFIEQIAGMPRRMSVTRIQLTHPSAEGGGGASLTPAPLQDELLISCTVTTYVVRNTG